MMGDFFFDFQRSNSFDFALLIFAAMAGYEPGIKAATASAVFKVRCKSTRPGEAVFVVGSHEALGAWSTAMALALTTTADTFPTWQSAPIPLLAGMMVEYKFIIQRDDRQGTPQWQKFDGNYRVTPVAGQVLWQKLRTIKNR
jgi:hypothetical protein